MEIFTIMTSFLSCCKNVLSQPWFMGLVSLVLVLGTLWYQQKSMGYGLRPYVGITEIKQEENSKEGLYYEIVLKNSGNVPANNVKLSYLIDIISDTNPFKQEKYLETIIFPNATGTLRLGLNEKDATIFKTNKDKWYIRFTINYDGVHTKNHKTELNAVFDHEINNFITEAGSAS